MAQSAQLQTFVINLNHRQDRWNTIQRDFSGTDLILNRFTATNGKEISESVIKDNTIGSCNAMCSPGMIGCWFSHYKLWAHIVQQQIPMALILEDDAQPVQDFNTKFSQALAAIPNDMELCYIGCIGTCGPSGEFVANLLGMQNTSVNDLVMIPAFPLALHAYLITYEGAKRLTESPYFQKVIYHVDFAMAFWYLLNPDFHVYALQESLINQAPGVPSDIANNDHPLLSSILSHVRFGNSNLAIVLNTQWANIRAINTPITGYTVMFALISLTVGATLDARGIMVHLSIMIVLGVYDVLKSRKTTATAVLDVLVAMAFILLGRFFRK